MNENLCLLLFFVGILIGMILMTGSIKVTENKARELLSERDNYIQNNCVKINNNIKPNFSIRTNWKEYNFT